MCKKRLSTGLIPGHTVLKGICLAKDSHLLIESGKITNLTYPLYVIGQARRYMVVTVRQAQLLAALYSNRPRSGQKIYGELAPVLQETEINISQP